MMEMQLDSLIKKIKTEAIEEARDESDQIISEAEEKKNTIIKQAEDKAEIIIKDAENRAAKLKDNSHKAIAQAVRDAALSLKEKIKDLFDGILKQEVRAAISDEFMAELLLKIAKAWSKNRNVSLEVLVNQKDKRRLEHLVISKFKNQVTPGINFKVNPNIHKGLYIGIKGEDVYYDFTDEAIIGILREYLRPFIRKIIDKKENG